MTTTSQDTSKPTQGDVMAKALISKFVKETVSPNPFTQGTPPRRRARAAYRNCLPHRK